MGATKDVSVTFTIKDAPVIEGAPALTCPGVVEMLTEDPTKPAPSIKATADAPLDTSVIVNALIKFGDEDKTKDLPAGYKISWTRGALATDAKKEETKTVAIQDDKKEDKKDDEKKLEVKTVEVKTSTDPSVTADRLKEVYDMCASLIDVKGVSAAGPSCVTIPAIEAPKPVNQNNYGPNNGPVNNRQSAPIFFTPMNTAAGGIL